MHAVYFGRLQVIVMIWRGFENGGGDTLAPSVDWIFMSNSDHFVQFNETRDYLVNSVAEYFVQGLKNRKTCIMVASSDHAAAIERGPAAV